MGTQVSPGVYSRVIDLSLYAPALSTTIFGIVGGAHKGPVNEPYYIGSISEFLDAFGLPTTQMGYAAQCYLREGRQLYIVRVADGDLARSEALLVDASDANTLYVRGRTAGTWADGLVVTTEAGTIEGVKISVYEDNSLRETFDNVTKANFDLAVMGSAYIVLEDADPLNVNDPKPSQNVTLLGGDDGLDNLTDADYIGTIGSDDSMTGLQCFSNPEILDVNIVAVPGISSAPVIVAGMSLAVSRQDCEYLADPPFGLSTQQVTDWHNGAGAWAGLHQAFNSEYGALQWAWHEVFDPYTNETVWIAPSGPTAAIYAYNDHSTETWFAPAGLTRGRVLNSLAIEHSPSQGQRDLLQGNQNAVNPFVNFSQDGIVLYGQRTLLRKPSALNSVNVQRLLLYAKKVLATVVKYLVFEPHDPVTWESFTVLAEGVLAPIKSRRGLYDYRIVCDESTNTSDLINQNKMVGKLLIKPTKTAEIIEIDWVVVNTGIEFTALV